MIVYFDTSAFVPLLMSEAGTSAAERAWDEASRVVSSRLLIVETAAAVAMGRRMGRVPDSGARSVASLDRELRSEMTLIEAVPMVIDLAANLADRHGLQGYDAMHLASASVVRAKSLAFASGDKRLLSAAALEGFTTVDTHDDPRSAL